MESRPIQILCMCGKLIYDGSRTRCDIVCPDCGRVYHRCEQCDEYYPDDDIIDGVCRECWDEILNQGI